MKQLLTTIAAVVLMGCGESQQSVPQAETKPVEPVAEASTPEPPTVKSPDISIHRAADEGNLEAVKQHLAAGTDVDAKNEYGETPLYWAAQGHKEIAELLIAKGVDVNAKNELEETPLHIAAPQGHKEIAELLITKGADVNAKSAAISTPLHFVEEKDIAKVLILNGADVNAISVSGTPLDVAIEEDYTETAGLLRKHGAKTAEELDAAGN